MSTLCIIKTHRNSKYSSISLTVEEDKNLSWGAKGLHTYLISRPPGWKVYFSELLARSIDGKKGLRSFIDELCAGGYLDWHQSKDEKTKRFTAIHYDVYEEKNEKAIENNAHRILEKLRRSQEKTESEPQYPFSDYGKADSGIADSAFPVSGKEATNINHNSNNHISSNQDNKKRIAPKNGATTPPESNVSIDADKPKELTEPQQLFKTIEEICGLESGRPCHKNQITRMLKEIKTSKIKATTELIKRRYGNQNGQLAEGEWNWFKHDWRGQKGSRPDPMQIAYTWGRWEIPKQNGLNGDGKPRFRTREDRERDGLAFISARMDARRATSEGSTVK